MSPPLLCFDAAEHRYYLGEEELLSVTTVLGLAGITDYSAVDADLLARRAHAGKLAHLACELDDLGDLDESSVAPEIAGYLTGYRAWRRHTGCVIEQVEMTVHHLTHRYAGTLDRVAIVCGRRAVIELKTSRQAQPWWALQTMAYAMCLTDGNGNGAAPLDRFALMLRADGTYAIAQHRDDLADRAAWLAALGVAHWKRHHMSRR